MDIEKDVVNYEFLYTLSIRNPKTEEPIGITMQIRSAASDAAKVVLRRQMDKNLERRVRGKLPKGEQAEQEELERAASYIESWEWGTNTFRGEVPQLTPKKAIEIMEALPWFYSQVSEAANKIENFSASSETTSAPN